MATLTINGTQYSMGSFWYNYKNNFNPIGQYSMHISYSDKELIEVIEDYTKCTVFDNDLERRIILLDKKMLSMGLLWLLGLKVEEIFHVSEEKMKWVLNNITSVEKTSGGIIIKGDADYFVTGGLDGKYERVV